ncbi:MAG: ABC transporter ATP-binding protein [Deltaproteobacteria bacterium]|nr:MAG: ABC transporter ATP-binding protein [Deltaproteobacteria bacterium]
MEKHLLEVKGVDVLYGDIQVIWGLSIHVDEGTIVALVGANGAGKTTLLKTISGIIHASSGEILFSGKSLAKLRPQEVVERGVSHVPEGRRLFSGLTVLENLKLGAYPPRARGLFDTSLERAYSLFPVLKDRKDQKAGSLSGGEQQMLAIARALMAQPALLMLDEPSLGLSPILVRTIFDLINTLNTQKVTILLVEQNIHQALKIAHQAYVLKTGKIAMNGSGEELLADPEVQKAYIGERWGKR